VSVSPIADSNEVFHQTSRVRNIEGINGNSVVDKELYMKRVLLVYITNGIISGKNLLTK
jgi:hypothetical protein